MTLGEKIKIARTMRNFTQKKLALITDLSDARIRQYELNLRTPKEEQLQVIASALGVPIQFFRDRHIESDIDIMHALFELDNTRGIKVHKLTNDEGFITEYAISFNSISLNNLLALWYNEQQKLIDNTDNTKDLYEKWKVTYPEELLNESSKKLHEHNTKK